MKSGFVARDGGTIPGMSTKMKRVLVPFSLIFVLESILTKPTCILLFRHMDPVPKWAVNGKKKFGTWGQAWEEGSDVP